MSLIMLNAYIESMLWSTSGITPDGEEVESLEDFEVALETTKNAESVCNTFFAENQDLIMQAISPGYDLSNIGHDLWLTRNGHGAGFWDRGLGEVGDLLTEKAQALGEAQPYIGENNLVYL